MTEQSSSKKAVADTDCVVDLMIRELLPVNKLLSIFFFSQQICICLVLLLFPLGEPSVPFHPEDFWNPLPSWPF